MNLKETFKTLPSYKAWTKVGIYPHHGLNIPLFSIRTKKSSGIGEFLDLLPLIDWCASLNVGIIQMLPLNDSGLDPSPYNAHSSCALHPIYLSLHALPYIEGLEKELKRFTFLNHTSSLLYHAVLEKKLTFLKEYLKTKGEEIKKEKEYSLFLQKQEWLLPYALFKVLKDHFHQKHWQDWPEEFKEMTNRHLKILYHQYVQEIEFYTLLQYLSFSQLKQVKTYADSKNILLKGDVPILISPDSCDVWLHRSFFNLDFAVGSPPNKLDPEGQYWGFPLYNWKALEQNHYEWWKKRLLFAKEFYHIFRIDHIIGFFRLFAIPRGQSPKEGSFIPNQQGIIEAQGKAMLDLLTRLSDVLPIGEDLGDVPPFVAHSLKEFGIPGTKVVRWQRRWEQKGEFIPYSEYEPMSMTTLSTHDIDTVPLWWEKNPEEAKAYAAFKKWSYQEKLSKEHLFEILWESHHTTSLFHINLLQEYLSLVPELTWANPEKERINYPGTIQKKNWSYRYKMCLEVLINHAKLNKLMQKIMH